MKNIDIRQVLEKCIKVEWEGGALGSPYVVGIDLALQGIRDWIAGKKKKDDPNILDKEAIRYNKVLDELLLELK